MSPRVLELGPLEMDVLGILDGEGPASVAEVQQKLRKSGHELAYTTVMTVLVRLNRKGILVREKEGRQFLYSVSRAKSHVGQSVFSKIRDSLFRNDRLKPILALLDEDAEITSDELRELRAAVDRKLKQVGGKGAPK